MHNLWDEDIEFDPKTGEIIVFDKIERIELIKRYGFAIKARKIQLSAIKSEKLRLANIEKSISAQVETLKSLIDWALNDGEKVTEKLRGLSIYRTTRQVVDISDESILDDIYLVETISKKPDKLKIKNDIDDGIEISGAELRDSISLIIK